MRTEKEWRVLILLRIKMVCWLIIKNMEKKLGRKLTDKEKKAIEKKAHGENSHEHKKEALAYVS